MATKSKELTSWDEELAEQATIAAAAELREGGSFFSTAGGQLKWNGELVPGNEMAVIVLDAIAENVLYEGAYNPDVITPPTCFAFSRLYKDYEDDMAPHEDVVKLGQQQSDRCATCEHNEWGSAETGRGKACRNTRRLALIPAGNFDPKTGEFLAFEEESEISTSDIGYLKLPVTSVKHYSAYVNKLKAAWGRPPYAVMTRVSVKPDKNQFRIEFEALEKVPDALRNVITERHEEAGEAIMFPYNLTIEEEKEAAPAPSRAAKRPAAKKKAAAKKKY